MTIHPARKIDFDTLIAAMEAGKAAGHIVERRSDDGLRLFCYSDACTYERGWNDATRMARGLIVNPVRGQVLATPFPKFHNHGENDDPIPDLPFEVFEKLDGSMIILFHDGKRWRCATKGSFQSTQAQWAERCIAGLDLSHLEIGATYLAEYVGPDNRIVVQYSEERLALLAAYTETGHELTYSELMALSATLGIGIAKRYAFASISDLISRAATLPATEEGYVIRFSNGHRLKVKGDEYRRIHGVISRCTPLAIWEAMQAGDDLDITRRQLPEEFWSDFDQIVLCLQWRVGALALKVELAAAKVAALADKEVGLMLGTFDEEVRPFIFAHRKQGGDLMTGRSRQAIFRAIRPKANMLPNYTPSSSLHRVMDQAG